MSAIGIFKRIVPVQSGRLMQLELEDGVALDVDVRRSRFKLDGLKRGQYIDYRKVGSAALDVQVLQVNGVVQKLVVEEHYGFIRADNLHPDYLPGIKCSNSKPSIFFHESSLLFDAQELRVGTPVVFTIRRKLSKIGAGFRYEAEQIELRSDVKAPLNAQSPSEFSSKVGLIKINPKMNEEACLERLRSLSPWRKREFAGLLEPEFIARSLKVRVALDRFMPKAQLARVYIYRIAFAKEAERRRLVRELTDLIGELEATDEVWLDIPDDILVQDGVWNRVPAQARLRVNLRRLRDNSLFPGTLHDLSNHFQEYEEREQQLVLDAVFQSEWLSDVVVRLNTHGWHTDDAEIAESMKRLAAIFASVDGRYDIWDKLPDSVLFQPEIWALAPDHVCMAKLCQWVVKPELQDLVADRFFDKLSILSVDLRDLIFSHLNREQLIADIVTRARHETGPEREQAIYRIVQLLTHVPLSENRYTILDQNDLVSTRRQLVAALPAWIQRHHAVQEAMLMIPAAYDRSDKSDAIHIKAQVRSRGIRRLIHLTRISNMAGICSQGALLSTIQLRSQWSNFGQEVDWTAFDHQRVDGYTNHVCCSITYYNMKMFWNLVHLDSDPLMQLVIKPDYLWKEGTLFCPMNAAYGRGRHVAGDASGFSGLFDDFVQDGKGANTRKNKPENLPTCIQAEVLISDGIPLDDIEEVLVCNLPGEFMLREASWRGRVRIAPGEFEYEKKWKH